MNLYEMDLLFIAIQQQCGQGSCALTCKVLPIVKALLCD